MTTIIKSANPDEWIKYLSTENNKVEYTNYFDGLKELLLIEALTHEITARPKTMMTPKFLYKAWYDLYEPLSEEEIPSYEKVELNYIKLNALACGYQYFFKEENMMENIGKYEQEILEYNDFFKNVLGFDINQYKEDCPAAFV